jgi:large subunit ribosomal protein L13
VSINDSNKDWYVIDATDVVLGRLASKVAHMLKGKHKPNISHTLMKEIT